MANRKRRYGYVCERCKAAYVTIEGKQQRPDRLCIECAYEVYT